MRKFETSSQLALVKKKYWDFPGSAVIKDFCLPMGRGIRPLVQEDPVCHGAAKPVCRGDERVLEAREPQLLSRRPQSRAPPGRRASARYRP